MELRARGVVSRIVTAESRKVEVLLRLGRAQEAAEIAAHVPEREALSPEFLRLRGRTLRAAGRHFDAEASFREALALTPQDAGLLADLATVLLGQRRHREALSFAREAVSARPEVAAYHALVGVIAENLQLDGEAERELQAARTLAPGDVEAQLTYGFFTLRLGKRVEAESAFRDALALDPRRAEAHRGLARAHGESGRLAEAKAAWAEALAIDPEQADPQLARLFAPPSRVPRWVRALHETPAWVGVILAAAGFAVALASPWAGVPLFVMAALGPVIRIGMEEE
jgi:tetratricopeptide (TPR) repeat protein